MQTKIATCCYCARRTILRNTAQGGHELACASCGAPLHMMKRLKLEAARSVAPSARSHKPRTVKGKRKRRTPLWRKVAAEIWDEIEDIFD